MQTKGCSLLLSLNGCLILKKNYFYSENRTRFKTENTTRFSHLKLATREICIHSSRISYVCETHNNGCYIEDGNVYFNFEL